MGDGKQKFSSKSSTSTLYDDLPEADMMKDFQGNKCSLRFLESFDLRCSVAVELLGSSFVSMEQ